MNIKKIINFCKQSNVMRFYEGFSEQWISDGCAIYPLFNLPRFNKNSIFKTFDIPPKQEEKMYFSHSDKLPSYIIFKDIADNDNILIPYDLTVIFDAVQLIPIRTSKGLQFINSKYLSVFNNTELLTICERNTKDGDVYFAIKSGLVLISIVFPHKGNTEELKEILFNISEEV